MKQIFRIRLKPAHEQMGLTAYAVAKALGLSQTTVRKYVDNDEVLSSYVPSVVITLAKFYGVDWRDPAVVEVQEEGVSSPEMRTALLTA